VEKQVVIRVFGRVQGVYFRQSTSDKARSLNIRGIVMNEQDGSVYIIARGKETDLADFLVFCKIGPPSAQVLNVIVEEIDLQNFSDFRIIR
jgi:acylphosphatase